MNYILPVVSLGLLFFLLNKYGKKEPFSSVREFGNLQKLQDFYSVENYFSRKPEGSEQLISQSDSLTDLEREIDENRLERFLLTKKINFEDKPNLFVFNPTHINARHWNSWGSRNSNELNQPYKLLCISSIIKKCGDKFNVVVIDDNSIPYLLPNWKIELNNYSGHVKSQLQLLALLKIIYLYGGVILPSCFICFDGLEKILSKPGDVIVGNLRNKSIIPSETCVSTKIIGCDKNSQLMKSIINDITILNSNDYTDDVTFNGKVEKILYDYIINNYESVSEITGKELGVINKDCNVITTDDLLSERQVEFAPSCIGVYINEDDILNRYKFQWFARMSHLQILSSNLEISNLFRENL